MCSISVPTDPKIYDSKHTIDLIVNKDIEDVYRYIVPTKPQEIEYMDYIVNKFIETKAQIEILKLRTYMNEASKVLKQGPYQKSKLLQICMIYQKDHEYYTIVQDLSKLLIKKVNKSASGILSVTLFTGPDFIDPSTGLFKKFSCKFNCHFCPSEPGQPKSYLKNEPGVLRANQNNFDAFLQFNDRILTLKTMGHEIDKLEILVLGGTFHSYPKAYREQFIRDIFYSANTFGSRQTSDFRSRLSLTEEKLINENADCKIIGLTLETRPDQINATTIRELRYLGCTRLQLGLQHTNDDILKTINRGHSVSCAEKAIRLLKDSGYKIDLHLMQNLPGSSPELDLEMNNKILESESLQVDQLKLYPCSIVPWTYIKTMYESGIYKPYDYKELTEVLIDFKSRVHPWIRLNRIIRDIPSQYITDNTSKPDMRNFLSDEMSKRSLKCNCIRCREIGLDQISEYKMDHHEYLASGSKEIFISFVTTSENKIIGFCRLRLPQNNGIFPELNGFALVRELHVYGKLKPVIKQSADTVPDTKSNTQHLGFGTQLMLEAERLAKEAGYNDIAVISGVGVRNYYRRLGYHFNGLESEMMIKKLE